MGGDRVGRRLGGAYAPLWTSLNTPYKVRAARAAGDVSTNARGVGRDATETGTSAAALLDGAREVDGQTNRLKGEVAGFLRQIRAG